MRTSFDKERFFDKRGTFVYRPKQGLEAALWSILQKRIRPEPMDLESLRSVLRTVKDGTKIQKLGSGVDMSVLFETHAEEIERYFIDIMRMTKASFSDLGLDLKYEPGRILEPQLTERSKIDVMWCAFSCYVWSLVDAGLEDRIVEAETVRERERSCAVLEPEPA